MTHYWLSRSRSRSFSLSAWLNELEIVFHLLFQIWKWMSAQVLSPEPNILLRKLLHTRRNTRNCHSPFFRHPHSALSQVFSQTLILKIGFSFDLAQIFRKNCWCHPLTPNLFFGVAIFEFNGNVSCATLFHKLCCIMITCALVSCLSRFILTFFAFGIKEVDTHLFLWKLHKKKLKGKVNWSNAPPKLLTCLGFLWCKPARLTTYLNWRHFGLHWRIALIFIWLESSWRQLPGDALRLLIACRAFE